MKDTIFDLWYGNIEPMESIGKRTPEIRRMIEEADESYEILTENLGEKEKELLEKHLDNYSSLRSEYTAIAFVEGYSLGVKMIVEALEK